MMMELSRGEGLSRSKPPNRAAPPQTYFDARHRTSLMAFQVTNDNACNCSVCSTEGFPPNIPHSCFRVSVETTGLLALSPVQKRQLLRTWRKRSLFGGYVRDAAWYHQQGAIWTRSQSQFSVSAPPHIKTQLPARGNFLHVQLPTMKEAAGELCSWQQLLPVRSTQVVSAEGSRSAPRRKKERGAPTHTLVLVVSAMREIAWKEGPVLLRLLPSSTGERCTNCAEPKLDLRS